MDNPPHRILFYLVRGEFTGPMFGYNGKILRVDLNHRKTEVQDLEKKIVENYIGGVGAATHFLYEETIPSTDPLGPENILIAFTGPFTGTVVPTSGRHHLAARSPHTGIFGESNVGGSWAVHFKKTGFDGIMVYGKSERPVYVWIHDAGIEIRDAKPIWGKDAYESASWLKRETSAKATCAVIGQAGERLAEIASIPHIGSIVRAAARTDLGAVMGSKKLKAIVAYGTKTVPVYHVEKLKADVKSVIPQIKKATETFSKYGTAGGIDNYEKIGNFPIQNWKKSRWKGAGKISGVTMHDTVLTGRKACLTCPIACGRHVEIVYGPYAPLSCEGPGYESIGTLGGECMVDDLAAICKANELCNRFSNCIRHGGI